MTTNNDPMVEMDGDPAYEGATYVQVGVIRFIQLDPGRCVNPDRPVRVPSTIYMYDCHCPCVQREERCDGHTGRTASRVLLCNASGKYTRWDSICAACISTWMRRRRELAEERRARGPVAAIDA